MPAQETVKDVFDSMDEDQKQVVYFLLGEISRGNLKIPTDDGDDESASLKHYGVLGMKWGIRKAEKRGEKYKYKSFGQKQYEKKVAKTTDSAKKKEYQKKLDTFKERDRGREDYVRSTTVGRTVAKGLLFGYPGSANYNHLRSMGYSKTGSAITAVLSSMIIPYSDLIGYGLERQAARKRVEARQTS